jgi:hypothetical protein
VPQGFHLGLENYVALVQQGRVLLRVAYAPLAQQVKVLQQVASVGPVQEVKALLLEDFV